MVFCGVEHIPAPEQIQVPRSLAKENPETRIPKLGQAAWGGGEKTPTGHVFPWPDGVRSLFGVFRPFLSIFDFRDDNFQNHRLAVWNE